METLLVGLSEPKNRVEEEMMRERQGLLNLLAGTSIPHQTVNHLWPRDLFVSFKEKIHSTDEHGNYAGGGYVLPGNYFTLVCEDVSKYERMINEDFRERFEKLERIYGENIQIILSPNVKLNECMSPHIDLVVLPVPEREVIFVDRTYYSDSKERIDYLCSDFKLKLELVEHDYSRPSWPCNSLVVQDNGRLFALTNSSRNNAFLTKLRKYDIIPLAVPFSANCREGGSIHCSTNTCIPSKIGLAEKICRDYDYVI